MTEHYAFDRYTLACALANLENERNCCVRSPLLFTLKQAHLCAPGLYSPFANDLPFQSYLDFKQVVGSV